MKFEDYYKEFCEVFGHPLWHMPMMLIGLFLMIEVMHTRYHADSEEMHIGFVEDRNGKGFTTVLKRIICIDILIFCKVSLQKF